LQQTEVFCQLSLIEINDQLIMKFWKLTISKMLIIYSHTLPSVLLPFALTLLVVRLACKN